MLGKITGKLVSPKKVQENLTDYNYIVGKAALIKGLPKCIEQGYKEQKKKGNEPTVDSIFNDISKENLDFYTKMGISEDYIKGVIKKVLEEKE
jgi:hypothetical protein